MSKITLNIVEPGSPTPAPVDPGIDPSVPNTGLFTRGIGAPEATIILSVVLILAIAGIVLAAYMYRKHKKAGKATKLVRIVEQAKTIIKSKKRNAAGLVAISLLVSACTFTAFMLNTNKSNTNAIEGEESVENNSDLTVNTSDTDFTIELGDEPVFAVLPVEVKVQEATQAGYTLTAYTDGTDLVSTTDSSNIIPMVVAEESELVALKDNTYGLSLVEPESQEDEVYTSLSTDSTNPTLITDKDYEATEANDTITIYYGFYITPDTPYGTYTSSDIYYEAVANRTDLAIVTFDGNGLYFNGDETQVSNVVRYDTGAITPYTEKYSYTSNLNDNGIQSTDYSDPNRMYPVDSDETFVYKFPGADKVRVDIVKTDNDGCPNDQNDYFTFWAGNYPNYTAKSYETTNPVLAFGNTTGKYVFGDYNNLQTDIDGDTVTFAYTTGSGGGSRGCHSGYGYYAILTGYTADDTPVYLTGNGVVAGKYNLPGSEEYYHFLGWSEDKDATKPTYITEEDIATKLSLNPSEAITLYAIWEPAFTISYNGNDADSTTNMDNVEQYTTNIETTSQVDLLASNFTKEGYGFVGWSTDSSAWEDLIDDDESNNPTLYGPNQTIMVDPSASTKLKLYAVWAPAEKDNNGNPVSLQNWQGCSDLTATTYDAQTGTLTVGKNTVTALTDNRDGNVYTVARLADGNCWMTENLRLDDEPELSQQNTNNPLLPITNDYAGQIASNRLSVSSDSWCTEVDETCFDQSNINTDNIASATVSPVFSQDFTNEAHHYKDGSLDTSIVSYGNYYNWYSATAGNGAYSTGEQGTETVAGDICPAGWNLPIGAQTNNNGSFSHLDITVGGTGSYQGTTEASNRWRAFPNNFIYSGSWYNTSASNGGGGSYWSSIGYFRDSGYGVFSGAYSLSVSTSSVYPGTDTMTGRNGGSVRCLIPMQTTVTFDSNGGGVGKMMNQSIGVNTTMPLDPNQYAKIGYRFIGWNTERDGSGISYADEQDYTAGEDNSSITLYAQWEEGRDGVFYIVYDGNGADTTTNMDDVEQHTTDIESSSKQVDLLASNFTKYGYGFVGWSADNEAWSHLTDNDDSNNPVIYGPNQTITVDPSTADDLMLYAVWAPAETDDSGDPVLLQDWQGCSNLIATTYDSAKNTLTVGKNTITVLTDSRDGNIYTVARLADGNCWMTENLRLDNEPELSQQNTNNPHTENGAVALKNNDGTIVNHLSPSSKEWCSSYEEECFKQSYLDTRNTTETIISPSFSQDFTNSPHENMVGLSSNINSYGNYYNLYSATAGNETDTLPYNSVVAGDICPAGWQLPVGNSNNISGSFYYLNQQMGANTSSQGSNNWRSFPNNYTYSGYGYSTKRNDRGSQGWYISSTVGESNSMNMLTIRTKYVYPGGSGAGANYGVTVRCVIKQ